MLGDGALFFGLWLQRPLRIAAVTPSSAAFAAAMAQPVDFSRPGMVLEFGAAQRAVVEPCLDRLGAGGRFLQMTNAFSSPLAMRELGLAGSRVAHVWRNLPPAQIWAYSRVTE